MLFEREERAPHRRWTDEDLVRLDVGPLRLRRWSKENFGLTLHTHVGRRLALALGAIASCALIDDAAFDHGYGFAP